MADDREQTSVAPKGTATGEAGMAGVTGGNAGGAGGETGSAAGTNAGPDRLTGGLTADERTQPGRDPDRRDRDASPDGPPAERD
jgi:hypothetical protein